MLGLADEYTCQYSLPCVPCLRSRNVCQNDDERLKLDSSSIFGVHEGILKPLPDPLGRFKDQVRLAQCDPASAQLPAVHHITANSSHILRLFHDRQYDWTEPRFQLQLLPFGDLLRSADNCHDPQLHLLAVQGLHELATDWPAAR